MTESEFIAIADRTLSQIGAALDAALAESEADVDWSQNDGILEIESESGGKLIVNRHVPNREIWVAAPSGGFHYRIEGGRWRDARGGGELGADMAQLLARHARLQVAALELPAG